MTLLARPLKRTIHPSRPVSPPTGPSSRDISTHSHFASLRSQSESPWYRSSKREGGTTGAVQQGLWGGGRRSSLQSRRWLDRRWTVAERWWVRRSTVWQHGARHCCWIGDRRLAAVLGRWRRCLSRGFGDVAGAGVWVALQRQVSLVVGAKHVGSHERGLVPQRGFATCKYDV